MCWCSSSKVSCSGVLCVWTVKHCQAGYVETAMVGTWSCSNSRCSGDSSNHGSPVMFRCLNTWHHISKAYMQQCTTRHIVVTIAFSRSEVGAGSCSSHWRSKCNSCWQKMQQYPTSSADAAAEDTYSGYLAKTVWRSDLSRKFWSIANTLSESSWTKTNKKQLTVYLKCYELKRYRVATGSG